MDLGSFPAVPCIAPDSPQKQSVLTNWDWVSYVAGTPAANAKLFLGVPASELGSTGTQSGAVYYQPPSVLARTVASFDTSPNWGGIMMWDSASSDANVVNGCNYAQQAASILKSGSPCGGGGTTSEEALLTEASTVPRTEVRSCGQNQLLIVWQESSVSSNFYSC
ncbi:hypothetical protein ZTR_09469 [Talaromyces verruculosus]|nr:hypothetical protein ZTR_09469 [Talaromyces verruculosus]